MLGFGCAALVFAMMAVQVSLFFLLPPQRNTILDIHTKYTVPPAARATALDLAFPIVHGKPFFSLCFSLLL